MTINIPKEHRQYEVIAKRFSKIKGVKYVDLDFTEDGMNLFLSNGLINEDRKTFEFPLRRLFFTSYANAEDVPNFYDIMELDDPEPMIKLGEAKANMFFNNITIKEL